MSDANVRVYELSGNDQKYLKNTSPLVNESVVNAQIVMTSTFNMAMKLISFCKFQEINMVNIRIDDET